MAVSSVALFVVYLFIILPVISEAFRMHCMALQVFLVHENNIMCKSPHNR